jgi:hypothetical protein
MALAVAQALLLVVRRRWPTLCLAAVAVAVAFGLFQLAGYVSTFASVHPFSSVSVKYEQ